MIKTWPTTSIPVFDRQHEDQLIRSAQNGCRESFDRLLRAYEERLRGFLIRRVGHEAAEDVLQETWIAAWSAIRSYRRRSEFKAWLFGIAVHKYHDTCRRQFGTAETPLSEVCERAPAPAAWVEGIELKQAIRDLLARLPAEQREVLELYYYAELTLQEVADVLERNLNTVKTQFYRAHAQAAQLLGQFDIGFGGTRSGQKGARP